MWLLASWLLLLPKPSWSPLRTHTSTQALLQGKAEGESNVISRAPRARDGGPKPPRTNRARGEVMAKETFMEMDVQSQREALLNPGVRRGSEIVDERGCLRG